MSEEELKAYYDRNVAYTAYLLNLTAQDVVSQAGIGFSQIQMSEQQIANQISNTYQDAIKDYTGPAPKNTVDFVNKMLRLGAKARAAEYDVSLLALLAQGALESAWGSSPRARADGNLFGIGVYKDSSKGINPTGSTIDEKWSNSIISYCQLISSKPYYFAALTKWRIQRDDEQFIRDISKPSPLSGTPYAADDNYATKVIGTMRRVRSILK